MYVKEITRTEVSLNDEEIKAFNIVKDVFDNLLYGTDLDYWINPHNENECVSRVEMCDAMGVLSFIADHPKTYYQDC